MAGAVTAIKSVIAVLAVVRSTIWLGDGVRGSTGSQDNEEESDYGGNSNPEQKHGEKPEQPKGPEVLRDHQTSNAAENHE